MSGPECINSNLAFNLFRMDCVWIGTQPKQIGKEMELYFSTKWKWKNESLQYSGNQHTNGLLSIVCADGGKSILTSLKWHTSPLNSHLSTLHSFIRSLVLVSPMHAIQSFILDMLLSSQWWSQMTGPAEDGLPGAEQSRAGLTDPTHHQMLSRAEWDRHGAKECGKQNMEENRDDR